MQKKKMAFTLIEVLIATSILTLTVFGVYKLIGENTKIIGNSDHYLQLNNLFPNAIECIENKGFMTLMHGNNYNITFGNTGTGCIVVTGTGKTQIDNIEYEIKGVVSSSGSNFIYWDIEISSDYIGKKVKKYIQIK